MDHVKTGFDRPQEDEFALCMLGQPSPYTAIAFPNNPPRDHAYLDLEGVPPRALAVVKTLSALASTAMMGAITVFTFKQALLQIGQADRSQTLGLPIALYWTPLLLGATLSVVTGALLALRHAAGIRDSSRAR